MRMKSIVMSTILGFILLDAGCSQDHADKRADGWKVPEIMLAVRSPHPARENLVVEVVAMTLPEIEEAPFKSPTEIDPDWDRVEVELWKGTQSVASKVVSVKSRIELKIGVTNSVGRVDFGALQPGEYKINARITAVKGRWKGMSSMKDEKPLRIE